MSVQPSPFLWEENPMLLSLALTLASTQGVIHPVNYALESRDERPAFGARLTKNHVRGIGVGMLLAQAEMPPPIPPPAGEMVAPMPARSLQDLRAEYQRLEESRPGLAGPIVMLAIGVPLLVVGAIFLYTFLIYGSFTYELIPLLVLGVAFGVVGLVLAIVGGVRLGRTIRDRGQIGQQMEDIKRQIDALESAPPPPPPPSSVERIGPTPVTRMVLASF
jgi:hypothetical protein